MPGRRRHRQRIGLRERLRPALTSCRRARVGLRRFGLTAALLFAGAPPGCSDPTDPAIGLELTASDFHFEPTEFLVKGGQQVTVTVVNRGKEGHNLSIPSIPVDLDFDAGRSRTVIFVPPDTGGDLEFFCKLHRDRGMKGVFRVRP